jgi:3-oxoacyl-[acyl-carrier protein] reductase
MRKADQLETLKILIVGAHGGIGEALTTLLVDQGHTIIALSRFDSCILSAHNCRLHRVLLGLGEFNLDDEASIKIAFKLIKEHYSSIDAIVHCAGAAHGSILGMITRNDFLCNLTTNLVSPIIFSQMFLRLLKKSSNPSIINISSISAFRDDPGSLVYACSKAALNQATRIMAKELGRYKIRVNTVAPGITLTPMLDLMDKKSITSQIEFTPTGRATTPREVAQLISFLISSQSMQINGQVIKIDGGLSS